MEDDGEVFKACCYKPLFPTPPLSSTIASGILTAWEVQAYQVVEHDFLLLSYSLWCKDIVNPDLS